jgi:hypothetical protein
MSSIDKLALTCRILYDERVLEQRKEIEMLEVKYFFRGYTCEILNEALKDILKRGGDTCANGAIVGGLVGAACGLNVIDESKIEYVLDNKENAADNEAVPSNYNKYSPGKVVSRFKQE